MRSGRRNTRWVFYPATALVLALVVSGRLAPQTSGTCYPPSYANVFHWPTGATVKVTFDGNGQLGSGTSDPAPKFSLDSTQESSWFSGMAGWNNAGTSGVTFQQQQGATGPSVAIVSTAWPTASITYTDSTGATQNQTYSACDPNARPDPCSPNSGVGAVTFTYEDHTIVNGVLTADGAAASITLINTNGTYAVNGVVYQIWDPSRSDFASGLEAIGTHEAGHTMGLGDQTQNGDAMSKMGGTNNANRTASGVVSNCDKNEVTNVYSCP